MIESSQIVPILIDAAAGTTGFFLGVFSQSPMNRRAEDVERGPEPFI